MPEPYFHNSERKRSRNMANYVLVHGSGHGAWCWQRVVPLLEAKGTPAWWRSTCPATATTDYTAGRRDPGDLR